MLKKCFLALATIIATMGFAFAQVELNKADQAALDGIKGLGPKTSKAILDERQRGGDFKDWADFEQRVKGIGSKSAVKLSAAGLTVNSKAKTAISPAVADAEQAGKKIEKKSDKKANSAASSGGATAATAPAAAQK